MNTITIKTTSWTFQKMEKWASHVESTTPDTWMTVQYADRDEDGLTISVDQVADIDAVDEIVAYTKEHYERWSTEFDSDN